MTWGVGGEGQCPLLSVPCLSLVLRNQSHKLNHTSAYITKMLHNQTFSWNLFIFNRVSKGKKSRERNLTCGIPSNSKWLRQIFQGQDTFLMPLKLYPAIVLLILSPDTLRPSPLPGRRSGSPGSGPTPTAIWYPFRKAKKRETPLVYSVIIHCSSHITGATSSSTCSKGTPHPYLCPHHGILLGMYRQVLFGW